MKLDEKTVLAATLYLAPADHAPVKALARSDGAEALMTAVDLLHKLPGSSLLKAQIEGSPSMRGRLF